MISLYEIGEHFRALDDLLEEHETHGGDQGEAELIAKWWTEYDETLDQKAERTLGYLQTIAAEAEAFDRESKRLFKQAVVRRKRHEYVLALLKQTMELAQKPKIVTPIGVVTLKGNGGDPPLVLDIEEPALLPQRFVRQPPDEVNRKEIIAALKGGEVLEFARFGQRGSHVVIK